MVVMAAPRCGSMPTDAPGTELEPAHVHVHAPDPQHVPAPGSSGPPKLVEDASGEGEMVGDALHLHPSHTALS